MRRWGEPVAAACAALLVGAAFAAEPLGWWGGDVHQLLPPLSANFVLLTNPDPLAALVVVVVAVLVVSLGPRVAARIRWGALVGVTWVTGLVWGFALALLRGIDGVAGPLANKDEYLSDVPRVQDVGEVLRVYTSRILSDAPGHWHTHDSGHPPLPLLFYTWLNHLGLGSTLDSGVVTAVIASATAPAVLVTLGACGAQAAARRTAPFLALTPLVTWMVVSADGMFAAVTAWGLAVLALAARRGPGRPPRWPRWLGLGLLAGLLLGTGLFLSYGLVLLAPIALGVLLATRGWRPVVPALAVILAIAGAFALAGFWWLAGERLLVVRYYQGKGALRPYGYWVWADVAVAAIATGPPVVAGLGALARRGIQRARASGRAGWWRGPLWDRSGANGLLDRWAVPAPAWLVLGALAAIAASTLSGLSKSEVERIWLPFMVWLVPAVAWLRPRLARWWLAASALWATALGVLYVTTW